MINIDAVIEQLNPVEAQHEIAKALAANCGYKLVEEDNERSLEIKRLIDFYEGTSGNPLIIEGLVGWKIRFSESGYIPYCVKCGENVD